MKELTLKELKAVVRRRVRSMLNTAHKQGRSFTLADCIEASKNDLRDKLKEINPPVIRGLLDNEYELWIYSAEREINECAQEYYMSTLTKLKSKDIARAEGHYDSPEWKKVPFPHTLIAQDTHPYAPKQKVRIRVYGIQTRLRHQTAGGS